MTLSMLLLTRLRTTLFDAFEKHPENDCKAYVVYAKSSSEIEVYLVQEICDPHHVIVVRS